MIRSKHCSRCGLEKVAERFNVKNRRTGQLYSQCKDCHLVTARESFRRRWPERKAELLPRARAWRKANWQQWLRSNAEYKRRMSRAAREEQPWGVRRIA